MWKGDCIMKRAVLFGCGQIGSMIARLVGTDYSVIAFIDNASAKWNTTHLGIPVESPECISFLAPDTIFLCVLDQERCQSMKEQLLDLNYQGEIITPDALHIFDPRVATMRLLAEQINNNSFTGDIAELGVFRGEFALQISYAFPKRTFHLFDTFSGFDSSDIEIEKKNHYSRAKMGDFSDTSIELVRNQLYQPERAIFYPGFFPDTYSDCDAEQFCFVSIDADLYAPTAAALPIFWKKLCPGGILMIHDVNSTQYTGAGKAVREFCKEQNIFSIPVCDLHGSVLLQKQIS